MGILLKSKLIRTIKSTFMQFITLVIIVSVGIALFISANMSYDNINKSYDIYKEKNRTSDYVVQVIKAPLSVVQDIEGISGIEKVNGRITKDVQIENIDSSRNISARLVSYSLPIEDNISGVYLKEGMSLGEVESGDETNIVLESSFAKENYLKVGDKLTISSIGTNNNLNIIGMGGSPEFMWPSHNPISEFESTENFAIVFIEKSDMERVFNLKDEVNQFLIKYEDGANKEEVNEKINNLLQPYGVIASYASEDGKSENGVRTQVQSLKEASKFLPTIFFFIEVAFIYTFLRQLINSQRLQIGIMKALGFENNAITAFYTFYCLTITILGSIIGIIIGFILSQAILNRYSIFLNLPIFSNGVSLNIILGAVILSIFTGVISGLLTSRKILSINPAEAMKAKPPKGGSTIFLEKFTLLWNVTSDSWKISLRSLARNKMRFLVTTFGIASAIMLQVSSMLFIDSKDNLIAHYFEKENKYTCIVKLNSSINLNDMSTWLNFHGVNKVEPTLEIMTTFKNTANGLSQKKGVLIGINENTTLKNIFDEEMKEVEIQSNGMFLNKTIAEELEVSVGDNINIELTDINGAKINKEIQVVGINKQNIGMNSYISIDEINKLMGKENQVNGAYIELLNYNKADFLKNLKTISNFDSVIYKDDQNKYGVDVVSNFGQRQREMASLKVMGFSNLAISGMLLNELIVETIIGLLLGLPLGRFIGGQFIIILDTEVFKYPNVISNSTYFIAIGITLSFVIIGHLLAMHKVMKFNFIETLK